MVRDGAFLDELITGQPETDQRTRRQENMLTPHGKVLSQDKTWKSKSPRNVDLTEEWAEPCPPGNKTHKSESDHVTVAQIEQTCRNVPSS